MISQCKGKDLDKVPTSKLEDLFLASIKYDGHYVQIIKKHGKVQFFTSGGKEFYIEHIADELINLNPHFEFIVEAEYIADTDGTLGNRGKAAKLTTYRTNFEKGLDNTCIVGKDIFKVFDCIAFKDLRDQTGYCPNEGTVGFQARLSTLKSLNLGTQLEVVDFIKCNLHSAKELAKAERSKGYEGLYLKTPNHKYYPGKRVNNAIKLKFRPTADLLCVDWEEGTGKYTGMIGSLVLQDKTGRIVRVGAGLSDNDRATDPGYFIGVVEIEYEQILDTYIQPTFVQVRPDKSSKDID